MISNYKIIQRNLTIVLVLILILVCSIVPVQAQQDSDTDSMPDSWETTNGLDANNSADADNDTDADGLTNKEEYDNGTDPNDPDTDGDGMPDGWEVQYGLDPNDETDVEEDPDKDGFNNLDEYKRNGDPKDPRKPAGGAESDDDKEEKGMSSLDTSPFCLLLLIPGIVILLVIIFVYTKMRRERLLEHKVRGDIFAHINKNPGVHYRGIMNELGLHMGTLTHHLNMLETQRYIKSYQDGMYRRFYPIDHKIGTGLILTEIQHKILQAIHDSPGLSQVEIAGKVNQNRKIVHYHVKLLSDAGFVHVEQAGRESRCYYAGGLRMGG